MAEAEKLRLMLVDDSAETREYMRKMLQFEQNIELVGMASNGQDAVELARETKPSLILMDINMPVMDGISAAEIIFGEMPNVRIVMMSVQSEMAYLRRAMQVGAREFLIKPFTHEELMNTLGEVSSLEPLPSEMAAAPGRGPAVVTAQPVQLATLVAVYSPRGGAGCSTVALNLAIALQGQRKAQVLLVDGNFRFGALDTMLNLKVSRSVTDLLPALDDEDPEALHMATLPHASGVRLLAAPPSPEMADLVSLQQLEKTLDLAQRRYAYVVVDVGSGLGDRELHFLDIADRIILLLTPDIPAIKNARLFLDVAQSLDYASEKILLVLNHARPQSGINAEAIERHIKHPIALSIPSSPRIVLASINRGVPLIFYERETDKSMPLTRQFLALSERVPQPGVAQARAPEAALEGEALESAPAATPDPQPKKKGLFGGLFRRGK